MTSADIVGVRMFLFNDCFLIDFEMHWRSDGSRMQHVLAVTDSQDRQIFQSKGETFGDWKHKKKKKKKKQLACNWSKRACNRCHRSSVWLPGRSFAAMSSIQKIDPDAKAAAVRPEAKEVKPVKKPRLDCPSAFLNMFCVCVALFCEGGWFDTFYRSGCSPNGRFESKDYPI